MIKKIAAPLPLAAALVLAACGVPPPTPAPLLQGATANYGSEDDTVVRRRLLARFPLGGPEAGLPAYLRSQGFKIRRLTNVGETATRSMAKPNSAGADSSGRAGAGSSGAPARTA